MTRASAVAWRTWSVVIFAAVLAASAFARPSIGRAYCVSAACPSQSASLEVFESDGGMGTSGADIYTFGKATSGAHNGKLGYCRTDGTFMVLKFNYGDTYPNYHTLAALERNTALCFGASNDVINIATTTGTCGDGTTYGAFAYGGYQLQLIGEGGADTLNGGANWDKLCGGDGNDTLNGGDGAYDDLDGLAGNDQLDGYTGNSDEMWGFDGSDYVLDYDGAGDNFHGEEDNEACVYDYGGNYYTYDCGNGASDNYHNSGAGGTTCDNLTNCWTY